MSGTPKVNTTFMAMSYPIGTSWARDWRRLAWFAATKVTGEVVGFVWAWLAGLSARNGVPVGGKMVGAVCGVLCGE